MNLSKSAITMVILIMLSGSSSIASADTYGINIDQSSLDILTMLIQRLDNALYDENTNLMLSIKAKVIISDTVQPAELASFIPDMIFQINMQISKVQPNRAFVNLSGSFGRIQYLSAGANSVAVLPDDGIFTKTNVPEMIPASLILPEDDAGLFTLINLLGGLPLGSLLYKPSGGSIVEGSEIGFVDELDPADLRATIRYRGLDRTDGGTAHVITVGSAIHKQYIKMWVLRDTLDLYQISIEDQRGTEMFIVVDEMETIPYTPDLIIDTSGLSEVESEIFIGTFMQNIAASPVIDGPVAADLYASYEYVPRTGNVTISSDGFDMQDKEDQLICEMQYKGTEGEWIPLETEYAGLAPIGHWNAEFAADRNADLGMYSFRVRYTDTSGNTSEWLESKDLVRVTLEPPRIAKTSPSYKELKVPVSAKIYITFSKPMNKPTAEKAFFMTSKTGKIIRGSFNWNDNTMIFTPSLDLEYDTPHIARISGAAMSLEDVGLDGDGDGYSNGEYYDDYIWDFTTSQIMPTLTFVPVNKALYKGDRFDISIMAKHITGMHKFSFRVVFDPKYLEVEKVVRSSFASWDPKPRIVTRSSDLWKAYKVNNSEGFVSIACDGTRENGVSGSGYLATLSFRCLSKGNFSIIFSDVSVYDANENQIKVALRNMDIESKDFHPSDINHDGIVDINDLVSADSVSGAPACTKFELCQNYPNPFNPETWLPYQLSYPSEVIIRIYRANGELIRMMDLGYREAGFYNDRQKSAYWDGTDDNGQRVSSGVYFYTIHAGSFSATRKMIISK